MFTVTRLKRAPHTELDGLEPPHLAGQPSLAMYLVCEQDVGCTSIVPIEDPTQRVAGALRKKLDAHGFSFQYAVVRYCEELVKSRNSRWRFEVAEFPVEVKGAATKIDFVLHATSQYSDHGAYWVCECKRTNSAIADWAFVRAPYTRPNRSRRFTVFESVKIEPTTGRLQAVPLRLVDLTEPYDLGLELKSDQRGEPGGLGRGAIEDAATQVFRGLGGLVDFFKDNPYVLRGPALVIPVIFTTAALYTSSVDLGAADLHTGTLSDAVTAVESPWLWFQYNLSSALRHSAPKEMPDGKGLTSLGSVLEYQHARSIAVVGPGGIESFLQQMPNNLEDIETLRP